MNILNIPVAQQPDGSIAPHDMGPGLAVVNFTNDPGQPRTAIIAFFGFNQAVVNFDETGRAALNYTMLNPGATLQIQNSVVAIINHLTQLH